MSNQSRLGSVSEAFANITIGFGVSYAATFFIFPLFGFTVSPWENFGITMCYAILSFLRGYTIRRFYNWRLAHDQES